jgi:hypothetical protein
MLVVQGSLDIIYSGIWHSAALEDLKPLLCCLLCCDAFYHAIYVSSVLDSVAICPEALVRLPFGMSQSVTEDTEKSIVTAAEKNIAIKSLVTSIGDNRCCKTFSLFFSSYLFYVNKAYGELCPSDQSPFLR